MRIIYMYIHIVYPDSQIWRDRFWPVSVINFRCQKGNNFHTESVISNNVGKLLLEIWQNLLTFYISKLMIRLMALKSNKICAH